MDVQALWFSLFLFFQRCGLRPSFQMNPKNLWAVPNHSTGVLTVIYQQNEGQLEYFKNHGRVLLLDYLQLELDKKVCWCAAEKCCLSSDSLALIGEACGGKWALGCGGPILVSYPFPRPALRITRVCGFQGIVALRNITVTKATRPKATRSNHRRKR